MKLVSLADSDVGSGYTVIGATEESIVNFSRCNEGAVAPPGCLSKSKVLLVFAFS